MSLILSGLDEMRMIRRIRFLLFLILLGGCERDVADGSPVKPHIESGEVEAFVDRVIEQQVFVEGGEFLMGDFGAEFGEQKIQFDTNKNSKPLHRVELHGFSMSRFKITNEEYQFYLKANGLTLPVEDVESIDSKLFVILSTQPTLPAHVDWYEAENYCSWLGVVSGLPFSLPTEAQWEYAARSRGQFLAVATDDGTYKVTDELYNRNGSGGPQGINISTSRDREEFAKVLGWTTDLLVSLPVDRFPPNPLGMYAMSDNGFEWVSDWYDPDYYSKSPVLNPQGPSEPVYKGADTDGKYAKVMRGVDYANAQWGGGFNVRREYFNPDVTFKNTWRDKVVRVVTDKTARCVVNSSVPVNP